MHVENFVNSTLTCICISYNALLIKRRLVILPIVSHQGELHYIENCAVIRFELPAPELNVDNSSGSGNILPLAG